MNNFEGPCSSLCTCRVRPARIWRSFRRGGTRPAPQRWSRRSRDSPDNSFDTRQCRWPRHGRWAATIRIRLHCRTSRDSLRVKEEKKTLVLILKLKYWTIVVWNLITYAVPPTNRPLKVGRKAKHSLMMKTFFPVDLRIQVHTDKKHCLLYYHNTVSTRMLICEGQSDPLY